MELLKLSSANQAIIANKQEVGKEKQTQPEQKKNGAKLLATGAAVVTAAVLAGIAISKGKIKSLSDINFDKGIATLKKNGENFSGVIKTKLPNGDKVSMKYADGVLQSSIRTGSKNISKNFSLNEKGEKIVEIIKNGTSKETNLTSFANKIKAKQGQVVDLINNNDALNSKEFSQKALALTNPRIVKAYEYSDSNGLGVTVCRETNGVSKKQESKLQEILTNKQAQEKALIKAEIDKRVDIERNAAKSQEKFKEFFEENLSNKSAQESAKSIQKAWADTEAAQQEAIKRAQKVQDEFFKTIKTPSKNAKQSAQSILEIENSGKKTIAETSFNKDGQPIILIKNKKTGEILKEIFPNETFCYDSGHKITITPTEEGKEVFAWYDTGNDFVKTTRTYRKDGKKFILADRTREDHASIKTVEHLKNGTSVTKIEDQINGATEIIIRDKKGNILNKTTNGIKFNGFDDFDPFDKGNIPPADAATELADWYIDYLRLCKKFGDTPRKCGIVGGADDHWYELQLRETDPAKYANYIQRESQRWYSARARLMSDLRENPYTCSDSTKALSVMLNQGCFTSEFSDAELIKITNLIKDGNKEVLTLVKCASDTEYDEAMSLIQKLKKLITKTEEVVQEYEGQSLIQNSEDIFGGFNCKPVSTPVYETY